MYPIKGTMNEEDVVDITEVLIIGLLGLLDKVLCRSVKIPKVPS
jgi:hypothetical protein